MYEDQSLVNKKSNLILDAINWFDEKIEAYQFEGALKKTNFNKIKFINSSMQTMVYNEDDGEISINSELLLYNNNDTGIVIDTDIASKLITKYGDDLHTMLLKLNEKKCW